MIASFIFVLIENGKFLHVLRRKILEKTRQLVISLHVLMLRYFFKILNKNSQIEKNNQYGKWKFVY